MDAKSEILSYLAGRDSATGAELRRRLRISRQALNVHVRTLLESGRVIKTGSTRGARYSLPTKPLPRRSHRREVVLPGLDEGDVYEELAMWTNLKSGLRPNVEVILRYAFTEMLNNAIEHSESERATVTLSLDPGSVSFAVRDRGIGVFGSLASKLALPNEETALLRLLQGKTTTMPEAHSGEGIFFTSKVADAFTLRSHRIQVDWTRNPEDVRVSERRFLKGSDVRFSVRRSTRRRIENVFSEFAPEEYDFEFQKTKVFVKLLRSDYVSRSEARRLLGNLQNFREIVLDFKDVKSLGQGFADEIFRVFPARYPGVSIRAENTRPVVESMIRHVHTAS